jgi:hypothetical protein
MPPQITRQILLLLTLFFFSCLISWHSIASSQGWEVMHPEAELHMARLMPNGSQAILGGQRPWYAIDWPEAEDHLSQGLRRLTRLDVANDSVHIQTLDDRIFDYPWLFAQQVGRWTLSIKEADRLREYLMRGGFLVVDDFHGNRDWANFFELILRFREPVTSILGLTDRFWLIFQEALHIGGEFMMTQEGSWWLSITTWIWEMHGSMQMILGILTQ